MSRKIRAKDATTGEPVEVDADTVKSGPIRNRSLPDSLLRRVRAVHARIRDVYDVNLEQFEITFMRDSNPEAEVAVWERISVGFERATALTPAEKSDPMVKMIIQVTLKDYPSKHLAGTLDVPLSKMGWLALLVSASEGDQSLRDFVAHRGTLDFQFRELPFEEGWDIVIEPRRNATHNIAIVEIVNKVLAGVKTLSEALTKGMAPEG